MASQKKLVILTILSMLNICVSLPAPGPQVSDTIPGSSFNTDSLDESEEEYYDEENDDGDDIIYLPQLTIGLLGTIGSQINGLIKLLQTKIAITNNIVTNKDFQRGITETLKVGGNLVTRIIPVVSRVIPLFRDLAKQVPKILEAGGNAVRAGQGALGTLTNTNRQD